eukprot:TRINITY_DN2017_c0_g1_i1.p1 TRINITY_DN2017_c0_g1~~TRINITY_DN2017_c0_g1_i1.p1  ORF type:complete len:416 (+),score=114.53 TRINITY_DN2017_c0_g1_i1:3-1250(+)
MSVRGTGSSVKNNPQRVFVIDKTYEGIMAKMEGMHKCIQGDESIKTADRIADLEQFKQKFSKELKKYNPFLFVDLGKIVAALKAQSPKDATAFTKLVNESMALVRVRRDLSLIYRVLALCESTPNYEELVKSCLVIKRQAETLHTPVISHLKKNVVFEAEVFSLLLGAQSGLAHMDFTNVIVKLVLARNLIEDWRVEFQQDSASSKGISTGWSWGWLTHLHGLLISKTSLYFFPILRREEELTGGDYKSFHQLLSKSEINFFGLIESFAAKTEVENISLIVDTQRLKVEHNVIFSPDGYVARSPDYVVQDETPMGIRAWVPAFSYPKEAPVDSHWPNIVSVIYEHMEYLNRLRDPLYFYDRKVQCTYFLAKVEPEVLLAVIYDRRKDSKDTALLELFNHITNSLRLIKLYETLPL